MVLLYPNRRMPIRYSYDNTQCNVDHVGKWHFGKWVSEKLVVGEMGIH